MLFQLKKGILWGRPRGKFLSRALKSTPDHTAAGGGGMRQDPPVAGVCLDLFDCVNRSWNQIQTTSGMTADAAAFQLQYALADERLSLIIVYLSIYIHLSIYLTDRQLVCADPYRNSNLHFIIKYYSIFINLAQFQFHIKTKYNHDYYWFSYRLFINKNFGLLSKINWV